MATKKGTEIQKWEAELEADAQRSAAVVPVGGLSFFGTTGGQLTLDKAVLRGSAVQGVIVDGVPMNAWFKEAYRPGVVDSPDCYAFGKALSKAEDDPTKEMVPHPSSFLKQAEACDQCLLNAFGSAPNGRAGKACGNTLRLGMILVENLKDAKKTTIHYLKVSPTNTRALYTYMRQLRTLEKRPLWGVVTEVQLHPDPKNQFRVTFTLVEKIMDGTVIAGIKARQDMVARDLTTSYPPKQPKADAPTKFAGKAKKK